MSRCQGVKPKKKRLPGNLNAVQCNCQCRGGMTKSIMCNKCKIIKKSYHVIINLVVLLSGNRGPPGPSIEDGGYAGLGGPPTLDIPDDGDAGGRPLLDIAPGGRSGECGGGAYCEATLLASRSQYTSPFHSK